MIRVRRLILLMTAVIRPVIEGWRVVEEEVKPRPLQGAPQPSQVVTSVICDCVRLAPRGMS
jgi:hypothetical protein